MKDKYEFALILLGSTFLGALGQVFFKMGVMQVFFKMGVMQLGILFYTYVAIGLVFYLASTVVYFYVLSRTHLSWSYGFTGLSYIFASFIAFAFLGEHVPILRWLGIIVIAIGTALIGVS